MAPIFFVNTKSGEKEEFKPLREKIAKMYNCGPTVYDYAHIGNLRAYITADLIRRTLEHDGYEVKQVINITDVGHLTGENEGDADRGEDKIEAGARREKKSVEQIVSRYTDAFMSDLESLNIRTKNTIFPRASDHIPEQIALIKTLEEKEYTYKTSDGIYFDTARFPDYGKLGNINLQGLQEGARIERNSEKRNPTDFALWKFSTKGEKREQEWESPWGVGYPGWHLECSAMALTILGKTIDIHTGGIDHIPTHHNNEIAQSESATGKPFARYWLHTAHLSIDGKKISKSLGNTIRLKEIVEKGHDPLAYRYLLLTSHYSSPLSFTWESLEASEKALMRLRAKANESKEEGKISKAYEARFEEKFRNDLDLPGAVAIAWDLAHDPSISPADKRATLFEFDRVLGLRLDISSKETLGLEDLPREISDLVAAREEARKNKDFSKADELRKALTAKGFAVKDSPKGPIVERL